MSSTANVTIHASQFPDAVQRDLLKSLRTREVNHKFHYDSVKQVHKWLTLHQTLSPSRNDAAVVAIYDKAFERAVSRLAAPRAHIIGLGCGGGQKDRRLLELFIGRAVSALLPREGGQMPERVLQLLSDAGKGIFYTPCDASVAMTLVARQTASLPEANCLPFVCDLATADDLPAALGQLGPSDAPRLVTFFGMIPNFEPEAILPKLASLIGANDLLLFSANLAPGPDYAAGVQRVLPQYDNKLTRDWLMTFLLDLGLERDDGVLSFDVEEDNAGLGLKRIVAHFSFLKPRAIAVEGKRFEFKAGERLRLFFSYRHTPTRVRELLSAHSLQVSEEWIAKSEEEGVFLVQRSGASAERR